MTFFVNDHVMQGSYNASLCNPPTMTIPNMEDGEFVAAQFHIHLGTEHSIDNTFYGADFHLVHTQVSGGGRYAVLGLELEPSEDGTDGVFHTLVEEWLTYSEGSQEKCDALESRRLKKGHSQRRLEVFDVYGLIPENATEYYYKGSLTTPPCSELVEWNVVDIPVKISQEDFDAITGVLLNYVGENCTKSTVAFNASSSRPINPLNNRTVTHKCPASSRLEAPAPTAGGAPTAPVKSPVKAPTSGSSSATCFLAAAAAAGLVASFCM